MKINPLSDQSAFEITQILYNQFEDEEEKNRLDPDHLDQFVQKQIKPLYPHKEYGEKLEQYTCKQYCCKLKPGRFFCCRNKESDDVYKDFGLGFCIFVKFLKHLTWFLGIVTLISSVPIIFYYFAGTSSNFDVTSSYSNIIFTGTSGIISESSSRCSYSELTQKGTSLEPKYQVTFQNTCSIGTLNFLGIAFTSRTLDSVYNCRLQKENAERISLEHIQPTPSSSDTSQFLSFNISQNPKQQYAVFIFECLDNYYQVGSITVNQSTITLIAVSIDLLILIMFIIFLISQKRCQNLEIKRFKTRELSIQDYSVQFDGFKEKQMEQQLNNFLREYSTVEKKNNKDNLQSIITNQEFFENIVAIKMPDTDQVREQTAKKNKYYKKIRKILHKQIFSQGNSIKKMNNSKQFIQNYFNNDQRKFVQFKDNLYELLQKFHNCKVQSKKNTEKIQHHINFVMRTPQEKVKVIHNVKKGFFKNTIKVNDRVYSVSEPPAADMIIWNNHKKWTCCRVLIVWILTLTICFCSYLLVGLAIFGRNNLLRENFSFGNDCYVPYTQEELRTYNQTLKSQKSYIDCFCQQQFYQNPLEIYSECDSWVSQYYIFVGIPILISLGVVIYNLIVSKFFRIMTNFQGHKTVTAQLFSYVIKRAFILIMNMGLIVLILQMKIQNYFHDQNMSFLFQGTFSDITSDWYLNIGVIIFLTLSFNIFLPILQMILLSLLKCLRRCWDKRCCRKTSQTTKQGFIKIYTNGSFPIEQRYADILAILAITLTFSAVIPLAYFLSFLSFLFMYLCDKILLFKVYQNPLNYSQNLHKKIFKLIYVLLLIHCATSLLLWSEPGLVGSSGIYLKIFEIQGTNQRFENMIELAYLFPYIIFFIILLLFAIFNETLLSLINKCKNYCIHKENQYHQKNQTDFYSILTAFQVGQLKTGINMQRQRSKKINLELIYGALKFMRGANPSRLQEQKQLPLTEKIYERTLANATELQKKLKGQRSLAQNIKLIGFAAYQQMLDNKKVIRRQKIQKISETISEFLFKIHDPKTLNLGNQSSVNLKLTNI